MRVDDTNVLLEVMDTAGQEESVSQPASQPPHRVSTTSSHKHTNTYRYSSLRDQYYAKGQGFMVVYSVVARATFDAVVDYQAHIQRAKQDSAFPLVLVGNKADLAAARKVTTREGQDLARTYKCPFFETSGLSFPSPLVFFFFVALFFSSLDPGLPRTAAMTNTNVEEAFAELARRVRDYRPGAGTQGAVQDSSDYYNGGGSGRSCCTLL